VSTYLLAVVAVSVLSSLGLWLSLRVARFAQVELLPVRYRRRVRWWLSNAAHAQLGCLAVALVAVSIQLLRTIG
jgi:hypothetical protein